MPTQHICRLIIVAPLAGGKSSGIATWLNANIGTRTVPTDLGPGLSATGSAPSTYAWSDLALTAAQGKQVVSRLCTLAGIAAPTAAQWDNATPVQRRTWWASVRGTVWTNYGVWCQLADNDGTWDDPDAALTLRGLKTIGIVQ